MLWLAYIYFHAIATHPYSLCFYSRMCDVCVDECGCECVILHLYVYERLYVYVLQWACVLVHVTSSICVFLLVVCDYSRTISDV